MRIRTSTGRGLLSLFGALALVAVPWSASAQQQTWQQQDDFTEYEWEADEGVHAEEWYDPSDWDLNPDRQIDYESDWYEQDYIDVSDEFPYVRVGPWASERQWVDRRDQFPYVTVGPWADVPARDQARRQLRQQGYLRGPGGAPFVPRGLSAAPYDRFRESDIQYGQQYGRQYRQPMTRQQMAQQQRFRQQPMARQQQMGQQQQMGPRAYGQQGYYGEYGYYNQPTRQQQQMTRQPQFRQQQMTRQPQFRQQQMRRQPQFGRQQQLRQRVHAPQGQTDYQTEGQEQEFSDWWSRQ